jgi:hypothetical protein
MDFVKLAPYLQDPLVLMGFVLLLFFGLARSLLKAGIIPQLNQRGGYRIISRLLLYGFLLALAIISVGFALKYNELSRQEQSNVISLINQELYGNERIVNELKKNVKTIGNVTTVVSSVMRSPGIPLLSTLFPKENLDESLSVPASLDYARSRLELANAMGLLNNPFEKDKFSRAGKAISATIRKTIAVVSSLADTDGTRYPINNSMWTANLPVLRKIHIFEMSEMEVLYQNIHLVRTNYTIVTKQSIQYLNSIDAFFSESESPITATRLASVLAAERLYLTTARSYEISLQNEIAEIEKLRGKILGNLSGT